MPDLAALAHAWHYACVYAGEDIGDIIRAMHLPRVGSIVELAVDVDTDDGDDLPDGVSSVLPAGAEVVVLDHSGDFQRIFVEGETEDENPDHAGCGFDRTAWLEPGEWTIPERRSCGETAPSFTAP